MYYLLFIEYIFYDRYFTKGKKENQLYCKMYYFLFFELYIFYDRYFKKKKLAKRITSFLSNIYSTIDILQKETYYLLFVKLYSISTINTFQKKISTAKCTTFFFFELYIFYDRYFTEENQQNALSSFYRIYILLQILYRKKLALQNILLTFFRFIFYDSYILR